MTKIKTAPPSQDAESGTENETATLADKMTDAPRIIDAVVDQHGDHWIRFGSTARAGWFSLRELQIAERDVFSRLSGPGMTFLTAKTRNGFKELIESRAEYRPALVAAHPGWVANHFVFGNGDVIAPLDDGREVIRTFEPNPKFSLVGTLEAWHNAVGPVVARQPLPLFVAAYALVGPVLRFAPTHILNPQAEIVGDRECGKSTLLTFAASLWAGDPESDVGGAETWDMTINALDPQKFAHSDSLLGLDEGNLAGISEQDQRQVIGKSVFKLAATGGRKRFTDKQASPNVRLAMLSTSNVPLRELVQAPASVGGAMESRILTVRVPKSSPHGVLASVPKAFKDSRSAIEALRTAVDVNYGQAARVFVTALVAAAVDDEKALCQMVDRLIADFLARLEALVGKGGSTRIRKTLAVTFAAGVLARKWGIIPKSWGRFVPALVEVFQALEFSAASPSSSPTLDEIERYVRDHRQQLVHVSAMKAPYNATRFRSAPGFLHQHQGVQEILIPARRFQRAFPDGRALMRNLRAAGRARTEGGKRPKLTIKAPSRICAVGRVYCIRLPRFKRG